MSMNHHVWSEICLQNSLAGCLLLSKTGVVFHIFNKFVLGQLWLDRNLAAKCGWTSFIVFVRIWGVCGNRCTAKFVGYVSQSRALMDSLHASLCLIFSSLHLPLRYASLFLCPLMHLDHCWGLCMLKWFSYVIRSHRGNKALTFPYFCSLFLIQSRSLTCFFSSLKWNTRCKYTQNELEKLMQSCG